MRIVRACFSTTARNHNFAQADALGLRVLLLVRFEIPLRFAGSDSDHTPDFFAHNLLGDELVTHVRLEVLKGNALILGRFFEIFQRGQVVFLANFVELFDQLCIGCDAQLFAFG